MPWHEEASKLWHCEASLAWLSVLSLLPALPAAGSVIACNAALSALGSQWQKALRLGEAAESSRLDVDAAGYDTLLAVCNQSGSWKEALFFVLFLYRGLHHGKKTCDFACLVQCSISNSFPLMALMLLNLETPQKPLV